MSNFRDSSKQHWTSAGSVEHINAGSLQRIADAVEKVAVRYDDLLLKKRRAEESRDYWRNRCDYADRRIAALRGVITRMRNKMGGKP